MVILVLLVSFKMMFSSISIPDVNTCLFKLERHPGFKFMMLNALILNFSCLVSGQLMKRSVWFAVYV